MANTGDEPQLITRGLRTKTAFDVRPQQRSSEYKMPKLPLNRRSRSSNRHGRAELDTNSASSRSVSSASLPLTSTAWCGPGPGPAHGRHRVPTRSALDECGDAVVLVAGILVAVVDREIEASSGAAPEMVKARDGSTRAVGDFRRVVVQQEVHQLRSSPLSQISTRTAMSSAIRSSRSSMVRSPCRGG